MFSGCYSIERHCVDFKSGSFTSEIIIGTESYKSSFTRTDSLQIEFFEGTTDSSTVRWINDCEVIFHTINPKRMVDKKDIHLKILTTTDSTYSFEYSYVGETTKQKGLATKIN
jgi:hypothetical protein